MIYEEQIFFKIKEVRYSPEQLCGLGYIINISNNPQSDSIEFKITKDDLVVYKGNITKFDYARQGKTFTHLKKQ